MQSRHDELSRATLAYHSRKSTHDNSELHLVDVSVTRWYHYITRCVRRALLLGEGPENRKEWIEHRLEGLAEIFAIAVCSNHAQKLRVPRMPPR
jgi:hypothetical protein